MDRATTSVYLRYLGFDQKGSVRSYRFDWISPGEEKQAFVVTADLSLFLKHRVGLQEGPALSLHLLNAELGVCGPAARGPGLPRTLTDAEMVAHLARRPEPANRGKKRAAEFNAASPRGAQA